MLAPISSYDTRCRRAAEKLGMGLPTEQETRGVQSGGSGGNMDRDEREAVGAASSGNRGGSALRSDK